MNSCLCFLVDDRFGDEEQGAGGSSHELITKKGRGYLVDDELTLFLQAL